MVCQLLAAAYNQFGSLCTSGFGFSSEFALATAWPGPKDR